MIGDDVSTLTLHRRPGPSGRRASGVGLEAENVMRDSQERYRLAWEAFAATGGQDIIEDNEIVQSWRRSREHGLDPNDIARAAKRVPPETLDRLLADNKALVEVGKLHVNLAYSTIKDSDVFITLASADGRILYVVGDSVMSGVAAANNIVVGADRTEKTVGTNAVGLAIMLGKHVQVRGHQHYNRSYHDWACSAAPIFAADGSLAGVVNIFCSINSVHQHTLSLTRSLADIISTDMILREKNRQLAKTNMFLDQVMQKSSQGIFIIDGDMNLVSSNDYAVSAMGEGLRDYIGRKITDFFLPPLPAFFASRTRVNQDVMLKTRTRSLWCAVEFNPICGPDDALLGSILFFFESNKRNMDAHRILGTRVYYRFSDLIGENKNFRDMVQLAGVAAVADTRILIQGESGTGKELFAQSIHNESPNKNGPFVPINCAAIPRELIESELFGYAPGAFTGAFKGGRPGKLETANHGTVFFDEIGDMPWDMQTKLLRVLQDNYVTRVGSSEEIFLDVRYIFATNVNLEEKVASGQFRKDLYYRLSVFTLKLPPLRERRDDIPLLIHGLAGKITDRLGFSRVDFDSGAMELLTGYSWPGNIRQLENVVERLILLSQGGTVTRDLLPDTLLEREAEKPSVGHLARAEKKAIEQVLARQGGNISASAKMLGISRKTLYAKMRDFGIQRHPRAGTEGDGHSGWGVK